MRHTSKKRAKLNRAVKDLRAAFVAEYGFCWLCGWNYDLAVHEIAKGSHREAALSERIAWMVACGGCNCGPLNDYKEWPLVRQLAVKWVYDQENFDLVGFNRLRGRADNAIVLLEVIPHICRELDQCHGLNG